MNDVDQGIRIGHDMPEQTGITEQAPLPEASICDRTEDFDSALKRIQLAVPECNRTGSGAVRAIAIASIVAFTAALGLLRLTHDRKLRTIEHGPPAQKMHNGERGRN
jgi:hypothetical protein